MDIPDEVRYPKKASAYVYTRQDRLREYYLPLESSLLRRVYAYYKDDFELFQYEVPDFLRSLIFG